MKFKMVHPSKIFATSVYDSCCETENAKGIIPNDSAGAKTT